jgi:DNA transformation protein
MYGGHGIYRETRMFAPIADDVLYFKVDASSQPRFVAAGSVAFVYEGGDQRIEMRYWRTPAACLEEPAAMHVWCAPAWEAACRAAAAQPSKRRSR